jgi:hypothetical protein
MFALLALTRVAIYITTMAAVTFGTREVYLLRWRDIFGDIAAFVMSSTAVEYGGLGNMPVLVITIVVL